MAKKRSSSLFSFKHLVVFLALLVMIFVAMYVGYFIGVNQIQKEMREKEEKTRLLMEQIKEIVQVDDQKNNQVVDETKKQEEEIKRLKNELRNILENPQLDPSHEYGKEKTPPPPLPRMEKYSGNNAKLVIIIDDVSYERDIKAVKSTGLPLVMSFLPPSSRHPSSAQLAQNETNYMVHLPLEAVDFNDEEPNTLRVENSEEEMSQRIIALKKLYPKARYYNNHTGSKFTSDSDAMEKLISVMKKENIQFVDSRTISTSKALDTSHKYGVRYLSRDVFLDHQDGVENIKNQIREAVDKAKKHGIAIAIGHPRPDTIEALKQSKDILGEVKLVGIDKI